MSDANVDPQALTPQEKRALLSSLLKQKAARASTYPVTQGQRSLWFISRLDPGSSAYHIFGVLRLIRGFDLACLRRALDIVVQRHPALRTSFELGHDGSPVQIVHQQRDPDWIIHDASAWTEDQAVAEWEKQADRPFDLERDPLLRILLLQHPTSPRLAVVVHHIVVDFWSLDILLGELACTYARLAAGIATEVDQTGRTLLDFVAWEQKFLGTPECEVMLRFWTERLSGELPIANLPCDFSRPPIQSHRGRRRDFPISDSQYENVTDWSRREGVTPYVTFLTAFHILLHHYTGQEDLLIGTPMAGRTIGGLRGTVGYFVNPVVLRTRMASRMTLRQVTLNVRESVLSALQNQDYPFALLVEKLQPARDASRSPLFQVAFAWDQPQAAAASANRELISELIVSEQRGAAFDLEMTVFDVPGARRACLQYNTDLFAESTIGRMGRHFMRALDSLLAAPEQRLGEADILLPEEKERLVAKPADSYFSLQRPENLKRWFEAQAERTPDAVALSLGGRHWTYRELNRRANGLARQLVRSGAGREKPIALLLNRNAELVIGILAILKSGAFYLPLDPSYPADRIGFMLADSGARLVLTEPALRDRLSTRQVEALPIDASVPGSWCEDSANPPDETSLENAAYTIYTSGSTGRPKGVVVTHGNVVRLLTSTEPWFGFGPDEVWTLFHSSAFDFSVWEIWGALLYGGRLVVVPYEVSRSPRDFLRLLRAERVTVLNQTPPAFRQLMQEDESHPEPGLPHLRYVIFGGEALDVPSLASWFGRHGDGQPRLINMYGITETTVHVTYRPVELRDTTSNRSVIGVPIPDLQLYVLNTAGVPVPDGVAGELHVGGLGLARCYWGRPELTAERFVPDSFSGQAGARLYRTGDLVRRLPDGDYEYLGRCDRQVKIRGFRMELGEIEARLSAHPDVKESLVQVIGESSGDKWLAAYFVPRGPAVDPLNIRHDLLRELPEYMVPAHWFPLETFPLTPNGKIDRRALPLPDAQRSGIDGGSAAPESEFEHRLAAIWIEILGINRAGVNDNFFDLGGHSLKMVRVQQMLKQRHQLDVPIIEMFQFPTIRSLARKLGSVASSNDAGAVGLARATARGRAREESRQRGMERSQRRNAIASESPEENK